MKVTDEMVLAACNAYEPRAAAPSLDYWGEEHAADMRRAVEAALSRAAAPEPLHESPAIQAVRDVLDSLDPWEIHGRALEEIRSAIDDIPCCESATAMVHAEDHGVPESEWEYRVVTPGGTIWLQTQVLGQAFASAEANPGDAVERRRKAGPWEPLPVGGETDGE